MADFKVTKFQAKIAQQDLVAERKTQLKEAYGLRGFSMGYAILAILKAPRQAQATIQTYKKAYQELHIFKVNSRAFFKDTIHVLKANDYFHINGQIDTISSPVYLPNINAAQWKYIFQDSFINTRVDQNNVRVGRVLTLEKARLSIVTTIYALRRERVDRMGDSHLSTVRPIPLFVEEQNVFNYANTNATIARLNTRVGGSEYRVSAESGTGFILFNAIPRVS